MPLRPIILKFGSSVLRSPEDLPRVVTEIYRYVREGRPVLAVVSAFDGETDRLIAQAVDYGLSPDHPCYARHVRLGEHASAKALQTRLQDINLSASTLTPDEMHLVASGPPNAALPVSVNRRVLQAALTLSQVVIVPGFSAVSAKGAPVLLGRGGSDLTALFLASRFPDTAARLIKDVDGLYTSDPNTDPDALRYNEISWAKASRIAGVLIQPQAVVFAKDHSLIIEVARIGQVHGTRISRVNTRPRAGPERRPLRVALLGDGPIGQSIAQRLRAEPERYEVTAIVGLLLDAASEAPLSDAQTSDTPISAAADLLKDRPDIVIETGCLSAFAETVPPLSLIEAINRDVHILTANKPTIAYHLQALQKQASQTDSLLRYESAVGRAAPILEVVKALRGSRRLVKIEGVLSLEMTLVMDAMSQGVSFEEALTAAREAGLTDEDPSSDFGAVDALSKAQIIAHTAFPSRPIQIQACQTISDGIGAQRYCKSGQVKQLVTITPEANGVTISVVMKGRVLPDGLSSVLGEHCGAVLHFDTGDTHCVRVGDAKPVSIAERVLGDLGDIERTLIAQGALDRAVHPDPQTERGPKPEPSSCD